MIPAGLASTADDLADAGGYHLGGDTLHLATADFLHTARHD